MSLPRRTSSGRGISLLIRSIETENAFFVLERIGSLLFFCYTPKEGTTVYLVREQLHLLYQQLIILLSQSAMDILDKKQNYDIRELLGSHPSLHLFLRFRDDADDASQRVRHSSLLHAALLHAGADASRDARRALQPLPAMSPRRHDAGIWTISDTDTAVWASVRRSRFVSSTSRSLSTR